jgi:hypothetical protein
MDGAPIPATATATKQPFAAKAPLPLPTSQGGATATPMRTTSTGAMPAVTVAAAPPPAHAHEPAPVSTPNARALFGAPDLPPMRPPAATLLGVGEEPPPLFEAGGSKAPVPAAAPAAPAPAAEPAADPAWAPPRAEPGDMGWDLVYGVKRSMATRVQPKYNFDDDDEPTSEIQLPETQRT